MQAPIFTESILDLCPDVHCSDVTFAPPPVYPVRVATPIPAESSSTDANATGVPPYPGAYVFDAPGPYTDPNPFTAGEVDVDISTSDAAQSPENPENLLIAYTATSASAAVPRLPRAASLSTFAESVVWNSGARRGTGDLERLEIRQAPRPRLPRLTMPFEEDGRGNESLLSHTRDGNWTATRRDALGSRPEPQPQSQPQSLSLSQSQSQSQSWPRPKVESGYGCGVASSSGSSHAQHQDQEQRDGQRTPGGRAASLMGSIGAVLSASAAVFRGADDNQNRLPDSTFHPERRGPQRESTLAKLSPFRLLGKVRGQSSSRARNSDDIENQNQVPNRTDEREDHREPDWGWIWNHQAESARDRAVSVTTSMSAPAAPGAIAIGPSGSGYGRNHFPASASAAHQRFSSIDWNPIGHGHRHAEATIGLGVGLGFRDSFPAQHAPPTTYPAALSAPTLPITRTTVIPVSTGSSPPLPPLPAPYPPPPAARTLRTAEVR